MTNKQFLTVQDVAFRCKVSKQSVYKAIQQGLLASRRFGRSVRVLECDLDRYLKRGHVRMEGEQ